jgi:hypothetical protein
MYFGQVDAVEAASRTLVGILVRVGTTWGMILKPRSRTICVSAISISTVILHINLYQIFDVQIHK